MNNNIFFNSSILITGGTGSWGNELTKQLLLKYNPKEIVIYSRGEHKQVEMKRKFKSTKLRFIIGDVRDKSRLMMASKNIDYIFHLSALKHVPVCEENPWEAVQTNIIGTENVIEASIENSIKKVVDVSTDKAVDPLNLYGITKACGEKLMIAANLFQNKTSFVCVRGGNVMGTNGSVIPLFKEQIKRNNEITVTDKKMTRFLMRTEQAIELVLNAAIQSIGGEVFVMKMPACKVIDLAEVMIDNLGNKETKIKFIGLRPGEKICEVLVSKYEVPNSYDLEKYFVILPQLKIDKTHEFYQQKRKIKINFKEFNSENTHILSKLELKKLLQIDGWLSTNNKNGELAYLETLDKNDILNFSSSEGWKNKII